VPAIDLSRITSRSSKPTKHRYHQPADRSLAVKFLGHAAHSNAALLKLSDSFQREACFPTQSIQLVNQQLIEFFQASVAEQPGALGTSIQRNGALNAVVGIYGVDWQLMKVAVSAGEVALGSNGLPVPLLLSTYA
jgi:hypothetical protein